MLLRCKQCGWEQDDFWDEDYNPLKSSFDRLEERLLENKIDGKRFVACELRCIADKIESMVWQNIEEWEKSKKCCPKCGKKSLCLGYRGCND